jgi:hypothetical protein
MKRPALVVFFSQKLQAVGVSGSLDEVSINMLAKRI